MKKLLAPLAALALLAAAVVSPVAAGAAPAAVVAESSLAVRAMSYNVLYASAVASGKFPMVPPADLAWDLRDDQVAAWVTREAPDVVGFQENMDDVEVDGRSVRQLNTVVPLLPDYSFVQLGNDDPIAYRTSRFTLVDDGATQIATADGTTLLRNRWVTWAMLQDRSSGHRFVVFNTHLSAAAEGKAAAAARVAEVSRILPVIGSVSEEMAIPFVLTGDLNTDAASTSAEVAPLTRLADAGLVGAAEWRVQDTTDIPGAVSLQSMTAIVNGVRTYKAVRLSGKTFDYVWAPRGALVRTYKVSTGPYTAQRTVGGTSYWFYDDDHVLPSDHAPVVAEVAFSDAIATLGATSTPVGSYRLTGSVYETYLRNGGWEVFGLPVTNRWRSSYQGVAVWTQRLSHGTIQWSSRAVRTSVDPATTALGGTSGFRDALAASGLTPAVVYRSGDLTKSSKTGRALLGGLLYGGRIIDLRTSSERSRRPDPTLSGVARTVYAVRAVSSPESLVLDAHSRAEFRKVLARVAATSGPVLVHCSDNAVRSGWAVALIMSAAGASHADVLAEYGRTSTASTADLAAAVATAEAGYGSMHAYLTDGLGLSESSIAALAARVG